MGHAKEVVGGIAKDKDRIAVLEGESPGSAGRGLQESPFVGPLDRQRSALLKVRIGWDRDQGPGPFARFARVEAHPPGRVAIVKSLDGRRCARRSREGRADGDVGKRVGVGIRRPERQFVDGTLKRAGHGG
jgi:hypothetical protein